MLFRSALALMLFSAATLPAARAADRSPSELVLVQSGSLPIILTAPHGGREPIPGIQPRNLEGKKDRVTYVAGGDINTDIMVQAMAREIRALTGKDVYMVMARFERKFIDANRGPAIATTIRSQGRTTSTIINPYAAMSMRSAASIQLAC